MTAWRLILRSLRHYWRTHLGIVLGAAVASAVLVGALLVGDSVRHTLRRQALARIGEVRLALASNDRLFDANLADRLDAELAGPSAPGAAPVLMITGIASTADQSRRATGVFVHGVDARFFALAPGPSGPPAPADDAVFLNERLARQLDANLGDEILVRVERPSALPRDMVLATTEDTAFALRVEVAAILDDAAFGRFSLQANQIPPSSAFVNLAWLAEQLDLAGRANLLLVGGAPADAITREDADAALEERWEPRDAELVFRSVPGLDQVEVTSDRIFIDDPVAHALAGGEEEVIGVLTYFVNTLRLAGRTTPYSTVAGVSDVPWATDLGDDEVVINEWLADDLEAAPGDTIEIDYFVLGKSRRFEERTSAFRVRAVCPIEGLAADRTLMPEFPGIAGAEDTRDWEPGIPIDLGRIRDKDEAYWDDHRGTPKAFVTLAAAQRMWSNRFGSLTALRIDEARGGRLAEAFQDDLDPADVGLFFEDVRTAALASGTSTTDFGGLFLGLSIFLIASALLLTALLFVFGIEQRSGEIGTLLAVGFRPRAVRRLLLAEAAVLAVVGGAAGAGAGLVYTRLVLVGLATIWRDAVASASLEFHASPATIAGGALGAILAALLSIWLALRKQVRRPAAALLAGGGEQSADSRSRHGRWSLTAAVTCVLGAILIIVVVGASDARGAAGAFFGAGALLLVGSLAASHALLSRRTGAVESPRLTIGGLGARNCRRRRGRSLATVALLAFGCFLVVSVGANRLDALRDAGARSSGTGGFALFGESTIPVVVDLNSREGRDAYGLGDAEMEGTSVIGMRVREGDDASCLNLNVAQKPRLVGVRPAELAERGAFTFVKTLETGATGETGSPWLLLEGAGDPREVPAIGDAASVTWALHKKVGDTLDYVDERGRPFRVRLVGTIANSILQGSLLVDRAVFERLYPSHSGDRMFLIDAPEVRAIGVTSSLHRALADVGMEVTPAPARLAEFNAVQNTYLVIFQLLGGLGLLLGSAGLGTVVLRNVLERRRELALLRAVGFRPRSIRWLVMSEHGLLLAMGLVCGTVSALIAVIPSVSSPGAELPIAATAVLLVAVIASGTAWVWLATRFAVRGAVLRSLQDE